MHFLHRRRLCVLYTICLSDLRLGNEGKKLGFKVDLYRSLRPKGALVVGTSKIADASRSWEITVQLICVRGYCSLEKKILESLA